MSIMLQSEIFYILEIVHTCLIFENKASQVFFFSPSFYKQQRIAEVAKLHHFCLATPRLLLEHHFLPHFFPGLSEEEGERGETEKQTRAPLCSPFLPAPGPSVGTPLLCCLPMHMEGLSVIRS